MAVAMACIRIGGGSGVVRVPFTYWPEGAQPPGWIGRVPPAVIIGCGCRASCHRGPFAGAVLYSCTAADME